MQHVPAPTIAPLDPVGAGDAFKAGFLAALIDGAPVDEAARIGADLGAM